MNNPIQTIPFANLSLGFIPVFLVVGILYKWSQDHRNAIYAISRMLVQLLLVGYFLAFIFDSDSAWVILTVLAVMVFTSSWIALRTVRDTCLEGSVFEAQNLIDSETKSSTRNRGFLLCNTRFMSKLKSCDIVFQ